MSAEPRRFSFVAEALARIDAFLPVAGLTDAAFGKRVANDGKFVKRLRAGAGVTARLIERTHAYIDDRQAEFKAICRRKYGRHRRGGRMR